MLTPKVILITAFLLILASSGLSVLNKLKLTAKNEEITKTQAVAQSAQADAAHAKTEQKKAQKAAEEATANSSALQTQLTTATSQVSDLNSKVTEADSRVKAKDTEIADLNNKLAAKATMPNAAPVTDQVTQQIADLTHQRDELNVVKEGLDTQLKAAQAQTAALQVRIAKRESGDALNGLRGRVLAVDRNWNFVVLDLGGRNGVNNNATMVVQRGGSLVGRVRITSVEPSQSVADIIPNSVPAGVVVQPGDTVVFSGS